MFYSLRNCNLRFHQTGLPVVPILVTTAIAARPGAGHRGSYDSKNKPRFSLVRRYQPLLA
jgi:hypothetical protein